MNINFDFNSIINYGEKLTKKINDPHNIGKLTKSNFEKVFNEIVANVNYTDENKLMFFAKLYDSRREKNIKEIIEGALPFLNNEIKFNFSNSDWFADFFDKSSKITTDDFKILWSRLLAEELNNPNTITKRLLHNLFLMNRNDAENFVNLSQFCFYDKTSLLVHPIIFFKRYSSRYIPSKISLEVLKELEQFSLIECDFDKGYTFFNKKVLIYTNHIIEIKAPKINAGNVRLTSDGQKLFEIIEKIMMIKFLNSH